VVKSFRRSLGALAVLLLGVLPAVNPLDEGLLQAQAATAGSGVCAQTVDNNSQIQVDLHDGDCVLQFKRAGTTVWTVPNGVTSVQFLIVGGGGTGWASEHGGDADALRDGHPLCPDARPRPRFFGPVLCS
jgi:hypothetical protein